MEKGCDYLIVDEEEHESLWMKPCGEPVVREGKCEKHKVERRRRIAERRRWQSTDSPTSCNNAMCHAELVDGKILTRHNTMCPDYGPGWA